MVRYITSRKCTEGDVRDPELQFQTSLKQILNVKEIPEILSSSN